MERAKAQADDCGQGEDESDEEWEWRMAMARAKADKTDEVERPARLADGSGPTPRMNKSELAAKPKSQSAYEMAKKLRPRQQRSGMTYLDKKRSMERKRKTLGQGPDTLVDNKPPGAGAEPRQGAPLPSIRKR
jgi:hypothetical protein